MIAAMEMHDSVVSSIAFDERKAIVTFDTAYIHHSEGPSAKSGTGWAQLAILSIENCALTGSLPPLPDYLVDGTVVVDGTRLENVLVLPFEASGNVQLELVFQHGDGKSVMLSGSQLSLMVSGEPRFVENVPFNCLSTEDS